MRLPSNLDLAPSRRRLEPWRTVILSGFLAREEKAQQARHKLDGWKQAFRLDKRLLYKLTARRASLVKLLLTRAVEKPASAPKSREDGASPKQKRRPSKRAAAEKSSSPPRESELMVSSIFLRMRRFPNSLGSIASPRRSLSRGFAEGRPSQIPIRIDGRQFEALE